LRALAAGWVMLFHMNAFTEPRRMYVDLGVFRIETTELLTLGWVGVDIFFALSGFLLTLHYLELRAAVPAAEVKRRYLRGRLLRVLPAYWAQIALLFVGTLLLTGKLPIWTHEVPAHLVFLQNAAWQSGINAVYWTLPIEFSFYLVLPFVVGWIAPRDPPSMRRAWLFAAFAVLVAVAWRAVMVLLFVDTQGGANRAAQGHLPGDIDVFAWGVAAAFWFDAKRRSTAGVIASDTLWVAGLVGLVGWMYYLHIRIENYWALGWLFYLWHSFAGPLIALLIAGLAQGGPLARAVFENRVVLWLGMVSYSVYLWHPVIVDNVAPRFAAQGLPWVTLACVPAVLLVSAASYYGIERPFLRRKRTSRAES
jgi:peptidoglycan/LPS O-acetylase OafA/YrhL